MIQPAGPRKRTLAQRLDQGGVICAEGYLFELERRGYLQAGSFVPEVALDNPQALAQLHHEFLLAGSDVVEAFTYNGHREKMRIMDKEHLLEPLNRAALSIAKQAAADWPGEPPLVAGNISNTNVYNPADPESIRQVEGMFREMVGWAAEAGVDFIVAETLYYLGEAMMALKAIKDAGLPAVVTLGVFGTGAMLDGVEPAEACRRLEDAGADVVGLNCFRGPNTMWPLITEIRRVCSGPVAALPVTYRTTPEHPTFFHLPDPGAAVQPPRELTFPVALDPLMVNRFEIADFGKRAHDLGVGYLGICCGNTPAFTRSLAEALGRTPPASRYSPDMTKQFLFGDDPRLKKHITDVSDKA